MAGNSYANYVIKYALDIIEEGPTRERLFGILQANLEFLVSFTMCSTIFLNSSKHCDILT